MGKPTVNTDIPKVLTPAVVLGKAPPTSRAPNVNFVTKNLNSRRTKPAEGK